MVRTVAAFSVGVVLVGTLLLGLLVFMLQGKSGQTSAVAERIRTEMQAMAGDRFYVELQEVNLDLSDIGLLQLNSNDIKITNRETGAVVANIGSLSVGQRILDLIRGNNAFDRIFVEDVSINIDTEEPSSGYVLPRYLDEPLDFAGVSLDRMQQAFANSEFEALEIRNIVIDGPFSGRRSLDRPARLPFVSIVPGAEEGFAISGKLETGISTIEIQADYRKLAADSDDAAAVLDFGISGISMLEWLESPVEQVGVLGSDAILKVTGKLRFDKSRNALDPQMRVTASPTELRVGRTAKRSLNEAELNLRLILDRNQVELDRSVISIGSMKTMLVGGLKPEDDFSGYYGPVRFDLIMQNSPDIAEVQNAAAIRAAVKFAGVFDGLGKILNIERMFLTTENGAIEGSGKIGLGNSSPSIVVDAYSNGISVSALKQFWPFFVAKGARDWVMDHVGTGWVRKGKLTANIPPGVIFELGNGMALDADQYRVEMELEQFDFRPFGKMPRITDAKGTVTLAGMSVSGKLDDGKSVVGGKPSVHVESGSFLMPDFAAQDRIGEVTLEVSGEAKSLAAIADREPLLVMQRMKVAADQFSGKAHADIAARFPVGRKLEYDEVDWNVLLELRNGKSNRKLAGRNLANADVLIDANPVGAKVTGTMSVDGIPSTVNLVEPIGKSGKIKRKREISATLDQEGRKAIGINLAPVVEGPVGLKIVEANGTELYQLDFTKSALNLPWVGWSKGAGIKATGVFNLERLKNGVRLTNFKLEGPGFGGGGSMIVDKEGLVNANITNVQLNEGDAFALRLERKKNVYNINASGLAYDARGVLNSLIHTGGFGNAQSGRSVNLVANFEKVRGFENRVVRNAVVFYDSAGGQLKRLDMRAEGSNGRRYAVQAQLNGNDTLFNIETNDAGTALAFTDIYTKMEGGALQSSLIQSGQGPYIGRVEIKGFDIVDEPRLARMSSNVRKQLVERGGPRLRKEVPEAGNRIRFQLADAQVERRRNVFRVKDAIIRNSNFGIAMDGTIYDENDRMDVAGTFMPANGLNIAVSNIPLLGKLFADGRSKALVGITYKLHGPRKNPELLINPLSAVAPGVFNKVFEFR